ncbi:hypothetical protein DPMN_007455 [Dreissena polymorpha]|uniref:Uncharacterized protein n=1 Tax=Dreissena polymorpha TaxID=45954 RepID=A0A9D4RYE0_DREPO|nr:hypothetical protein DPMN_007455 [Dreissena polymorpha]
MSQSCHYVSAVFHGNAPEINVAVDVYDDIRLVNNIVGVNSLNMSAVCKKAAQLNDKIKNRQLLKTKRKSETNIQKRNTNEAKSFDEEQFEKKK